MKLFTRKLQAFFMNWLSPHISTCRRCGRNWNICDAHDVWYTSSNAYFTHCEDCWEESTVEEKMMAAGDLIFQWESYGRDDKNGMSWIDVRKNIYKAIRNEQNVDFMNV